MTAATNTTVTVCRSCRAHPVLAVGLCRKCGQRQADAERNCRHKAERRQHAAGRFERRIQQEARHWQAPAGAEPDGDAA